MIIDTSIITHRGLEPSNTNFFPESSFKAFQNHINRGFGIEFDPNFTQDGIIISHDLIPKRTSPTLIEILDLIQRESSHPVDALHLKGKFQTPGYIKKLLDALKQYPDILPKTIIFDIKPETARLIKQELPTAQLAPSVAHDYDIARYNQAVSGTLISIQDALTLKPDYDWVWLDEWDLSDAEGLQKKFYTAETFSILKNTGYKIALVTPELHGTSPGLLGGESHPDAKPIEHLMNRIKEILALNPDVVCTDYPEEVRKIMTNL